MYSSRRDGRSPTNSRIRRSSPASTSRGDADPAATVAAAEDAFGPVSVLVNNAGIGRVGSIEETEPKAWRQVIDINLTGHASWDSCCGVLDGQGGRAAHP